MILLTFQNAQLWVVTVPKESDCVEEGGCMVSGKASPCSPIQHRIHIENMYF